MASTSDIFDRTLRRMRRDRAARAGADDFLTGLIADELLDRLDGVQRRFSHALDLGCGAGAAGRGLAARGITVESLDAGALWAAAASGVQGDEDQPAFPPAGFDLIVSAGVLDTVNDLPGALALARRMLAPDGLLLAGFWGAGSLPALRRALGVADAMGAGAAPRLHPQIDVRAAGDLLGRVGFALPVADRVGLDLRYPHLPALVADLRAAAATNLLVARDRRGLGRAGFAAAAGAFADAADPDGKTREHLEMIVLTGWAPSPTQPQPARRGSAGASLADALKPTNRGDVGWL